MKIAVIQHCVRPTADEDVEALIVAVKNACEMKAQVIVLPWIPSLASADPQQKAALTEKLSGCAQGTTLLMAFGAMEAGHEVVLEQTPLGVTAFMRGDECLSAEIYAHTEERGTQAWVWHPLATSDLQAEAIVERAIAVSASHVGLILLAEACGGEPGETGHGSSAVLYLGDILSEAVFPDEILLVDVDVPVPFPEPREPLPPLSPILEQRLAIHEGRKLDVGYLADLS